MKIEYDADLSPLHTFGLPARAAVLCVLEHTDRLPEILRLPEYRRETVLWLGGGSNVLFMQDYPGLVVRMATRGIEVVADDDDTVRVRAQAGEVWHDFVQHTLALGLSGLENLSLIPGTVGAAPVQNIGAYGVEVKERIVEVDVFDLETRQFAVLSRDDCRFAYRDSLFKQAGKGRYVITAVTFALSRRFTPQLRYGDLKNVAETLAQGGPLTPQLVAEAVCRIRRSKLPDPAELGNCGSFYKNPVVSAGQAAALRQRYPGLPEYPQADGSVKLAAGWLIDQCGLKGWQEGGAAVHDRQALVLVNRRRATAADVARLSEHICRSVQQRFGVDLEPEPIWL
ncbi:UDP-N-acetylmuramate dehydrogenase [Neisseria shayeganii]|uniref:UDP-N-acetylenolpyruvoylglucosamine reductase n=1 Tax=Neisseria shayeganii 871 TaxID=1032488 RepID=G4CKZ4_9NEIS|nr:UDP-N-acetylmuramate dehydrogenase [Neisseria shayeganii]EGY51479.1 UDP-N-acetylmuramate dehydrogenase [Neisseria shayeganii 871]